VKHLNLVDLSEAMSSLYDSVAEKDEFNSRRSLDVAYEKMKVMKPCLNLSILSDNHFCF